jgi:hypothetical protein
MRILICGGRDFNDFLLLDRILEERWPTQWSRKDLIIIQGGAKGADILARDWAEMNVVPFIEYPAEWNRYGKSAGFIRNKRMLDEGKPDLVIAFPGGRGTAMMVQLAREAGVPVEIVP